MMQDEGIGDNIIIIFPLCLLFLLYEKVLCNRTGWRKAAGIIRLV
jgi:hypothetical protein